MNNKGKTTFVEELTRNYSRRRPAGRESRSSKGSNPPRGLSLRSYPGAQHTPPVANPEVILREPTSATGIVNDTGKSASVAPGPKNPEPGSSSPRAPPIVETTALVMPTETANPLGVTETWKDLQPSLGKWHAREREGRTTAFVGSRTSRRVYLIIASRGNESARRAVVTLSRTNLFFGPPM